MQFGLALLLTPYRVQQSSVLSGFQRALQARAIFSPYLVDTGPSPARQSLPMPCGKVARTPSPVARESSFSEESQEAQSPFTDTISPPRQMPRCGRGPSSPPDSHGARASTPAAGSSNKEAACAQTAHDRANNAREHMVALFQTFSLGQLIDRQEEVIIELQLLQAEIAERLSMTATPKALIAAPAAAPKALLTPPRAPAQQSRYEEGEQGWSTPRNQREGSPGKGKSKGKGRKSSGAARRRARHSQRQAHASQHTHHGPASSSSAPWHRG